MRSNRGKGNKSTELTLIKVLRKSGLRGWRRNSKLPGSPDIVYPSEKLAIFTDGCFWHGHNCRNTKPATNKKFWQEKIQRNKDRDRIVADKIKEKGWKVLRIWECELMNGKIDSVIERISVLLHRSQQE